MNLSSLIDVIDPSKRIDSITIENHVNRSPGDDGWTNVEYTGKTTIAVELLSEELK